MDEFLSVQRDLPDARRTPRAHPKGWEPGIDTSKGLLTAVSDDSDPPSDWSGIIRELGLDPTQWTVDESQPCQVRTWDVGAPPTRMYYYRATVIPSQTHRTNLDIDVLIREVKRRRPRPPKDVLAERALVVCLADWQAGKADHGGHEALLERLWALKDAVPARVRELKRMGRPVSQITIVGMGDLVEGCTGHYPGQEFNVELDRRQQLKLVRRMLKTLITEWASLSVRVVVGCVPGNHGENRSAGGGQFTRPEDNADLEVFEQVQEILSQNERFQHVSWVIPDGDLTITLDVAGTIVAFAHGHQAKGSGLPLAKLRSWWQGKMAARHPVGDASVLVFGHYHHLQILQDGPRTIMGCPSNDGGSRWYEEAGGPTTACGTLTFVCEGGGWRDLAIL